MTSVHFEAKNRTTVSKSIYVDTHDASMGEVVSLHGEEGIERESVKGKDECVQKEDLNNIQIFFRIIFSLLHISTSLVPLRSIKYGVMANIAVTAPALFQKLFNVDLTEAAGGRGGRRNDGKGTMARDGFKEE